MKKKVMFAIAIMSLIPLAVVIYGKFITYDKRGKFICEAEIVARIDTKKGVLKIDGIRGFFLNNKSTLQVNTSIHIDNGTKSDWYYRDITYHIESYDKDSDIMRLKLLSITNHSDGVVPPEVMDNLVLYHNSNNDNIKYIKIKKVSSNYVEIGDIYSPYTICLIK